MGTAEGFAGVVGRYRDESESGWPEPIRPAPGAPNVLVVRARRRGLRPARLLRLRHRHADLRPAWPPRGLRYSNFHTTALCSPTRACLLTGRNHHSRRHGPHRRPGHGLPRLRRPHPRLVRRCCPRCSSRDGLRRLRRRQVAPHPRGRARTWAPPRDRWPLGQGFERFYGFFDGETHQFGPRLVHDNHAVEPAGRTSRTATTSPTTWSTTPSATSADLRNVEPDKPFFLYLAPGACHSPHQAPPEWIERYRGRFDDGWDDWRERDPRQRQKAEGMLPEPHRALAATRVGAGVGRAAATTSSGSTPATWRLRRLPRPTPTTSSAGSLERLERTGDLDDTLVVRDVATTAPAPRAARPARSTTSGRGTSLPRDRARGAGAHRRDRRAARSTTTTRGAGRWPATPRSGAGSARPTRAAWPTR